MFGEYNDIQHRCFGMSEANQTKINLAKKTPHDGDKFELRICVFGAWRAGYENENMPD